MGGYKPKGPDGQRMDIEAWLEWQAEAQGYGPDEADGEEWIDIDPLALPQPVEHGDDGEDEVLIDLDLSPDEIPW